MARVQLHRVQLRQNAFRRCRVSPCTVAPWLSSTVFSCAREGYAVFGWARDKFSRARLRRGQFYVCSVVPRTVLRVFNCATDSFLRAQLCQGHFYVCSISEGTVLLCRVLDVSIFHVSS